MATCPVCFSEIRPGAIKCSSCLSFIKPKVNEGQFWGTALLVAGILTGLFCYIVYIARVQEFWLQVMNVGIGLAYLGFLVYGLGTFLSWFRNPREKLQDDASQLAGQGLKRCFCCGEAIDLRAIKCTHCYSFLRRERGKILATFVVVSGMLLLTTSYVLYLARSLHSEIYIYLGMWVIIAGLIGYLVLVLKRRYQSPHLDESRAEGVEK